jgi:hypothetical protein
MILFNPVLKNLLELEVIRNWTGAINLAGNFHVISFIIKRGYHPMITGYYDNIVLYFAILSRVNFASPPPVHHAPARKIVSPW